MLKTGRLRRAELYDDHSWPYSNVKTVYEANKDRYPGAKLVVTNAHWYAPGPRPCGNYKVNNEIISREWDSSIGFSWSGNERPKMGWSNMSNCNNFVGTIPAIVGGKIQDVSNQTAGVRRSCTRTWWGFDAEGNCMIEVATSPYTLAQTLERMADLGVRDGIVLDGSGSSQLYDGSTHITGDGRTVYSFLLLWFDDTDGIIDADLQFAYALTPRSRTTMLVLHHSASNGETVQDMHSYHKNTMGWAGIAYHYYVRKDGSIYRGRPEEMIGGHTAGFNSVSIGVCAEGDYTKDTMPNAQIAALKWLVADIQSRWPGLEIYGHRDLCATSCPGGNYPMAEIAGTVSPVTSLADRIADFQRWLNVSYSGGLLVDGIYGQRTKAAGIRAYQKIVGVKVDGVWGPKTRAATKMLSYTSHGNAVKVLQGFLYCHGFDPGELDGVFGRNTTAAVRAFQTAKGLTADGVAGENTFAKLMG